MSSPTPPTNSPPLTIGTTFLKQYYKVLTTTPDMICRFYQANSVLSHGEGNKPTVPATMESLDPGTELKDRFFSWADSAGAQVRFELEHGAIDAQESVGGGVLLVVTGHLYVGDSRKSFCHTVFLNCFSAADSKKRQYYVHNDILRFLNEETPSVTETSLTAVVEDSIEENGALAAEKPEEEPVEDIKEEEAIKPEEPEVIEEIVVEEAIERVEGVEETKEEPVFDDEVEEISESVEEIVKIEPPKEEPKEPAPKAVAKPPPGSWASLVAGSGSIAPPAPVVPKPAPKAPEKKKEPQVTKKQEKKDESAQKGNENKQQRHKRDPDCTLVIKGVPDGTKEGDVRIVFEPFAIQTNAKILGITVSQRGLAFVDYDAAAPVLAALEKKDQFSLNGKSVDVDQKTNDNKNRNRGGNNNTNNNNRSNGSRGNSRGNSESQRQRNNGSRNGGGGGGGGARNGKSGR